ncbi:MAG: membrane protein insertase YidC [Alphaproteobacteria bacterium]|jgi:YidC/Oxa1 family membrane protein insertase|nr:membrane protein insertase YidC [Alphaproteobacteria bacterium]
MMSDDKRNLIILVVFSTLILLGWNYLFPVPTPQPAKVAEATTKGADAHLPTLAQQVLPPLTRQEALSQNAAARLPIKAPLVSGSLSLVGARFDDVTLSHYHETTAKDSALVTLLSPERTTHPYWAEFGWLSQDRSLALPGPQTKWQTTGTALTPETPVTLTWDNGQGLLFERTIAVDKDYLFTITDKVINHTDRALDVTPYGLIARQGTPKTEDLFILHEGPIGYLSKSLVELKYSKLQDVKTETYKSTEGWMGITDKYWLTALVPDQKSPMTASYRYTETGGVPLYQVDFTGKSLPLAPGASASNTAHFFAGAKVLSLLDGYEAKLGVPHFDLAVDFGWYYLITKPIFHFLTYMYGYFGNFGIAILVLTLLLKLAFFPIANKQYRSMARMRDLQPKVKKLQERFAEDKMRLNQEMMELYKKEKVNPVSGCLPMLIQIPVFFALYKVIYITIEMRHAPFFGWIHDLSVPDPTNLFTLFGLISWTPPSFMMLGAWPILMGLTMWAQQKLNPAPADPAQAKVFMIMPIVFTFILANFPAGLVIYWTWSNLLTIMQQGAIMHLSSQKNKTANVNK